MRSDSNKSWVKLGRIRRGRRGRSYSIVTLTHSTGQHYGLAPTGGRSHKNESTQTGVHYLWRKAWWNACITLLFNITYYKQSLSRKIKLYNYINKDKISDMNRRFGVFMMPFSSDCTFRVGFSSLINNISCTRQSNLSLNFLRTSKHPSRSSGIVFIYKRWPLFISVHTKV